MPANKKFIINLLGFALLVLAAFLLSRATRVLKQPTPHPAKQTVARITQGPTMGERDTVSEEYLIIKVRPEPNVPVAATGWQLTDKSTDVVLGGGVPIFIQGVVNLEEPIVATRETDLVVSSGHSPLGVNFRENMCTGLLAHYQTFVPPLVPECDTCAQTSTSDLDPTITYPDYNACVEAHKSEPGFASDTWRIYLGRDALLWADSQGAIKLVDHNTSSN